MPTAPFVTNAVAVAMATAILTAMDAGTQPVVEIYSGTAPVDADAAITGTLLASLLCNATSAGSVAASGQNGRLTFAAITPDSSADATGTATHFRIKTQTGGTVILQGTVGTTASDMILNTVAITAGSTVSLSSGTVDVPE